MKIRELIKLIEDDGWYYIGTKGSHRQFKNPTKKESNGSWQDEQRCSKRHMQQRSETSRSQIMRDRRMEYVVIYEKGDNSYGAYVPDLPGCITVGETLEETQTLIQEAIEFHIEGLQEDGEEVPQPSLNIPVQYDIPYLGIHKVVENYVYNDNPALFSCKDSAGHLYLITVGEDDQHKTWFRVRISNERFNLIRSGGIDLRNAFIDNENGYLLRIKVPHNTPKQSSPEVIHPNEIPEDMLPFPGERLGLKTETLPALKGVSHV